jgi:hypothetical protein
MDTRACTHTHTHIQPKTKAHVHTHAHMHWAQTLVYCTYTKMHIFAAYKLNKHMVVATSIYFASPALSMQQASRIATKPL